MKIGQAIVDFDAHQIFGPAGKTSVEPKVMQVLSVLVDNEGQVVTRDDLIDAVWGVGFGGEGRLSRAISLLRKALGDNQGQHQYIQTIPKRGYILSLNETATAPQELADTRRVENVDLNPSPRLGLKSKLMPLLALFTFVTLAGLFAFLYNAPSSSADDPPLVIIMDSAHPSRIYDESVRADGGTNADILSDILSDLPIKTQKELVSPNWHRYESITKFNPDLIVIHYSGFKHEDASGDRPQLRLLIDYFQNTETEFLIYSRATQDWLDGNMDIILSRLYAENPDMAERIHIYPLLEYGAPHWLDQASAQGIKLKIKNILELE